jgi:hypothetical protein
VRKNSIQKILSIIDFGIPYSKGLKERKNNNITHAILKRLALASIKCGRYATHF